MARHPQQQQQQRVWTIHTLAQLLLLLLLLAQQAPRSGKREHAADGRAGPCLLCL